MKTIISVLQIEAGEGASTAISQLEQEKVCACVCSVQHYCTISMYAMCCVVVCVCVCVCGVERGAGEAGGGVPESAGEGQGTRGQDGGREN